jgi:D-glycero-D-manno-heptose 1,7-bisphosphate phosphatase
METLLGESGAYIDDIFICPHHPDSGYEGERPEYKIDCECRKPKPGLLLQAAGKYNIDLSKSWMVGDRESDIAAGRAAGCQVALLSEQAKVNEEMFTGLYSFIENIVEKE